MRLIVHVAIHGRFKRVGMGKCFWSTQVPQIFYKNKNAPNVCLCVVFHITSFGHGLVMF